MRDHLGFFASFFQSAVSSAVSNMADAVEGSGLRVGRRRRARRWSERSSSRQAVVGPGGVQGGEDYYMVPPERALVPVTAYARRD
jgi:hypothetical protein